MYLEFFKKNKIYLAIVLALLAGFLLSLGFISVFKKEETYIPVKTAPTDENLVYFNVDSQTSVQTPKNPEKIDESDLDADRYNQQMAETLSNKPEVCIPVEEVPQKLHVLHKIQKHYKNKQTYVCPKYYPKIIKFKKIPYEKTVHCHPKSACLVLPMPFIAEKEIKTLKLEYANAFDLEAFINKNIPSVKPVANAKGNSIIILSGTSLEVLNAEKIASLLDTRPKVAVFKLNYIKPCKMANMLANTIFDGNCTVCVEGDENSKKLNPYAIYYNNSQNSITIAGASKKQMDLAQDFIQFTDIKSPQAFLDILVVEFNDEGSKQFQKISQFDITQNACEYGISGQNLYASVCNIISGGGGKILAKPHLTAANDSSYNINVTSDYVKCKQSKDNYQIEQDCGIKLKIYSCINQNGEVFLTLEPQYVTVKKSIPNEKNARATLFNRKSFKLENVKMKDRQTLFFGGVNSQQEYKKLGRVKLINTELVMFVNVRILD